MDYQTRRAIYQTIEAERKSKAILYVTGDRSGMETQIGPDVVDLFVDHLDLLWPTDRISLILHTPGGNSATAWRLINLLRTFCNELEVIVPSKALSAGTLMCLGAERVIMTKQATLGPIDPSLNSPLSPQVPGGPPTQKVPVSVEAVQGYLDVAQAELGIKDPASLTTILIHLSERIHPLVLGQIFRTRTQIRSLARQLLSHQRLEAERVDAIIQFLCSNSGSHDHTINRREARQLGLTVENPSDAFYATLRSLDQSIAEHLKLRSPFALESELAGQANAAYSAVRALIESVAGGSDQFVTEGTLTRVNVQGQGQLQIAIANNRTFEGWRREAP